MRKAVFAIVILAGIMAGIQSCSESREHRMALQRAVSVINDSPDSALHILDSLKVHEQHFGRHFRMQCSLYRTNALNKLDTLFCTTDGTQQLADYFDNHGTPNEKMLAHYLLGRAYYDTGESSMALKCFQDAVAMADTTAKDCDYWQLSRVYGQMGDLFYDQRSPQLSIEMNRKAYTMAIKASDSINAIIFYWNIAGGYFLNGDNDSALYISKEAAKKFIRYGRKDMAAGTLPVQIDIYLYKKQYTAAKKVMDEYERYSRFVNTDGIVCDGHEAYYESKGTYYNGICKLDSALFFYRKFLNLHSDISDREEGYRGLLSVYQKLGITDSIIKYSLLFTEANDSANIKRSALEFIRMQAIYNYSEKEHIANIKTNEAKDYKLYTTILIIIIVILGYAGYEFYQSRKKKANKSMQDLNAQYVSILDAYKKVREEISMLVNNNAKFVKKKEDEIKKYQQQIAAYMEDKEAHEKWEENKMWLYIDEVTSFHQYAKNINIPTEKEWSTLKKIMDEKIPSFIQKLYSDKYGLTENEIKTAILVRLGFIPSEISVLLYLSPQRITNIRSSINMKLFKAKGTKLLRYNILKF